MEVFDMLLDSESCPCHNQRAALSRNLKVRNLLKLLPNTSSYEGRKVLLEEQMVAYLVHVFLTVMGF
jgi:hypothetical protein